jgi:hypothetical protein
LWDEDERVAAEQGAKRDMYGRDACQGFTRFFIRHKVPVEMRAEVLINALKRSKSIYPATRFWRTDDNGIKKHAGDPNLTFTPKTIVPVRTAVVERLKEALSDARFLHNPDLLSLLYTWADLPELGDRSEWINSQIKDDNRLLTFLVGMIAKGMSGERVIYYISGKYLGEMLPEYNSLKPRLVELQRKHLSEWQFFAVDQVLKRINEKENNLPEPDLFL